MTATPTSAVFPSSGVIRLTFTARDLSQALRVACAPLRGVGMTAARRGRVWAQLSPAGQLRFTAQWRRQWARAYAAPLSVQLSDAPALAPRPLAQLPDAPVIPPLALTLDGVTYLSGLFDSRLVDDDSTVRVRLYAGGLSISRIGERRWTGSAAHRPQGAQDAPCGPFPLPTPPEGPAMPSGALADLAGLRQLKRPDSALRLYPVPDSPTLTAWTLGDWAHGRSYLPPALRTRPASTAAALAARERGIA